MAKANIEKEVELLEPVEVEVSAGCKDCDNTGLASNDAECPTCNGSPFGIDEEA